MKKLLLSFLGTLVALPGLAFTYEYGGQKLNYDITDEDAGTCSVSGPALSTISGEVAIPAVAVNGETGTEYTVTSLADRCFYYSKDVTSVTLPEGVVTLGEKCFAGCPLVEMVLPESLRVIGDECFNDCPLEAVRFGSDIERIGSRAFSNLSQIEVNENLTYLGDRAFGDNIRLLRISRQTPPEIRSARMGYAEDLAYNILVIVPANGDDVYRNDSKWKGFHIVEASPVKTVHMTGRYPLSEEITTTTQQMPGDVTGLAIVGPLADSDWDIISRNLLSCYSLDLSGVTNTEIPAGVFTDNMHLLSMRLPSRLTTIGEDAFRGCRNLAVEELPSTLETIGDRAFKDCSTFNPGSLPASLRRIGEYAFANCRRLQLTELPAVERIGAGAFKNCPRFMSLDMGAATVTAIEDETFSGCVMLREVVLPGTLTAIGRSSFLGTAVNFMEFPESLREIGETAFSGTPLISVEFPGQFTTLDKEAFSACPRISTVSFSGAMRNVGEKSFRDCRGIESISVPCQEPPVVGNDAFLNVRYRDCMVAVPTLLYRDYLNALGWGSFTQLSNSIFLDYEEVDENGGAVAGGDGSGSRIKAGAVEDGTYRKIVADIIEEDERAAEDRAMDEALFGEGDRKVSAAEIADRVRLVRAEARAAAEATADAKARRAFTRLYPGLSMTVGDNDGYRVKLQPGEGVEIVKIEFGGKDITSGYVDGIVTLPALYSGSTLKVYRKVSGSGVGEIGDGGRPSTADVYNLQGMTVLRDATEAQVRGLRPGVYIYKGRKVVIR